VAIGRNVRAAKSNGNNETFIREIIHGEDNARIQREREREREREGEREREKKIIAPAEAHP